MIRPPASTSAGIALLVVGVASTATALIDFPFRSLGPALGFGLIVVALGVLGKPGQFVRQLGPFVGRDVTVKVFGHALPDLDATMLRVASIESLAFGLWIRLRLPSGERIKLKVAQPTKLVLTPSMAEVSFAGYVQWNSRRIKGPDGRRAPGAVTLIDQADAPRQEETA